MDAGIGLAAIGQALDDIDMVVEVFGVELDAFVGVDAGFANFLDLGLGQRIVMVFLRGNDRGVESCESEERCRAMGKRKRRRMGERTCTSLNHKRARVRKEVGDRPNGAKNLRFADDDNSEAGLLAKDFEHGFALGPIHLRKRCLDQRTIFSSCCCAASG